jgi:uncharacterized metal-binding protein
MSDIEKTKELRCDHCDRYVCRDGIDCFGIRDTVRPMYEGETLRMHRVAAEIESEGYMKDARLVELIKFGRKMGYRKVGIAYCVGMADEIRTLAEILRKHFEVTAVCCKTAGIDKKDLGNVYLRDVPRESACNPVGQAEILGRAGTDLNVIAGLCIGHDILFTEHSRAPVTTFIVKDRVLGHNPAAALYSGYYRRKLKDKI